MPKRRIPTPSHLLPSILVGLTSLTIPSIEIASAATADNVDNTNNGDTTDTDSQQPSCSPLQNTLHFTLSTDAHSLTDNSWKLSHSAFGTIIGEGSINTNDAVIIQTFCADSFAQNGFESAEQSCYDLEIHDDFGDGLTLPHSDAGGVPGHWELRFNGVLVAEHRPPACLLEDVEGQYNVCAGEFGFEYCGIRVCTEEEDAGGVKGVGSFSVTNLAGSECQLAPRTCSAVAVSSGSDSGESGGGEMSPMTTLVTVEVDTDSFADEFSWELRRASEDHTGEMIMSGGDAVVSEQRDIVVLGQLGVGVQYADNERYTSTTCQPQGSGQQGECYDFRAFDAYGDGLGCGADGSILITIDNNGAKTVNLWQKDDNFAKVQRIVAENKKGLACMNEEGLNKWSYCAVRLCTNGDVTGLPGNECSFGMDGLVDEEGDADVELFDSEVTDKGPQSKAEVFAAEENPMVQTMDTMNSQFVNSVPLYDTMETSNSQSNGSGKGSTLNNEFANAEPLYESSETGNSQSNGSGEGTTMNNEFADAEPLFETVDTGKGQSDESSEGIFSLAQYYESQTPGYEESQPSGSNNNNNNNNNNNSNKDDNKFPHILKPKPQEDQQALSTNADLLQETVEIDPFYVTLLSTDSPYFLEYSRPDEMVLASSLHLMEYFSDIEGWEEDNAPQGVKLDCSKSKEQFGSETRWVMECEGSALFGSKPLPQKKLMNDFVHQAFAGDFHQEFLGYMYPEYASREGIDVTPSSSYMSDDGVVHVFVGGDASKANQWVSDEEEDGDDELTKKEKKEQKQQMKDQMEASGKKNKGRGGGGMRPNKAPWQPMAGVYGEVGYTFKNGVFSVMVGGDAGKTNSKGIDDEKDEEDKKPQQAPLQVQTASNSDKDKGNNDKKNQGKENNKGKKKKNKKKKNQGNNTAQDNKDKMPQQQQGKLQLTSSSGYYVEGGVIHVNVDKRKKQNQQRNRFRQRQKQQDGKDGSRMLRAGSLL